MPYLLKLISTLKIYEIHGTLRYGDPIKIDDNAPQGPPVRLVGHFQHHWHR